MFSGGVTRLPTALISWPYCSQCNSSFTQFSQGRWLSRTLTFNNFRLAKTASKIRTKMCHYISVCITLKVIAPSQKFHSVPVNSVTQPLTIDSAFSASHHRRPKHQPTALSSGDSIKLVHDFSISKTHSQTVFFTHSMLNNFCYTNLKVLFLYFTKHTICCCSLKEPRKYFNSIIHGHFLILTVL